MSESPLNTPAPAAETAAETAETVAETILSPEEAFQQGLERYKAGEAASTLIPMFKEICDQAAKSGAAWTCLSWLYLMDNRPSLALKAAKRAVKLAPQDAQSRVNLAIAMLETQQKGVRQQIEAIEQLMMVDEGASAEISSNLEEGLARNPACNGISRIQAWLFGNA